MILHHEKWDLPVFITAEEPTVLIFKNLVELYNFQKDFLEQIETSEGYVSIFDDDKPLKIEKDVEYIPNVFTLSINTRKTINYLYKEIILLTAESDEIIEFEDLKKHLIEWIKRVRKQTFIDFSFEDDFDIKEMLKVLNVKFQEREDTPAQLLVKYIDLLINMAKIKVVFIAFAFYLLLEEEINFIIDYCKKNEVILVFIEKENPKNENINNVVSIIDDFVLK